MGSLKGFHCVRCGEPAIDMFLFGMAVFLPSRWSTWRRQEQGHPIRIAVGPGLPAGIVCGRCAPEVIEVSESQVSDTIEWLRATRRRLNFSETFPAYQLNAKQHPTGRTAGWVKEALGSSETILLAPQPLAQSVLEDGTEGPTWTITAFAIFIAGELRPDLPFPRLAWEWIVNPGSQNEHRVLGYWVFPSMTVTHDQSSYYRRLDHRVGEGEIPRTEFSEGNYEALTHSQWTNLRDEGDALLASLHRGPGHPKGPEYDLDDLMDFLKRAASAGKKRPTQPEAAEALGWTPQTVYRRARDSGGWGACWNEAKKAAANS